ncbi:MAG: hypothetical protein Q4C60_03425 [Eubacteriales bacterium]|nr:hypothetical protein [Eubacteriales bacterium]
MFGKKKGEFGYIEAGKKKMILLTALMLIMVLLLYFVPLWYFGTNKNLFTILAALGCLPLGKSAVSMVMFLRARGCSPQVRSAVLAHAGEVSGAYDLYMTSYSKNFQLSHLAAAGKNVCAFTETASCDAQAGEKHILKMMEDNGFHGYTVKIFYNLDKYVKRLDELNALQGESRKDFSALFRLLYSISL